MGLGDFLAGAGKAIGGGIQDVADVAWKATGHIPVAGEMLHGASKTVAGGAEGAKIAVTNPTQVARTLGLAQRTVRDNPEIVKDIGVGVLKESLKPENLAVDAALLMATGGTGNIAKAATTTSKILKGGRAATRSMEVTRAATRSVEAAGAAEAAVSTARGAERAVEVSRGVERAAGVAQTSRKQSFWEPIDTMLEQATVAKRAARERAGLKPIGFSERVREGLAGKVAGESPGPLRQLAADVVSASPTRPTGESLTGIRSAVWRARGVKSYAGAPTKVKTGTEALRTVNDPTRLLTNPQVQQFATTQAEKAAANPALQKMATQQAERMGAKQAQTELVQPGPIHESPFTERLGKTTMEGDTEGYERYTGTEHTPGRGFQSWWDTNRSSSGTQQPGMWSRSQAMSGIGMDYDWRRMQPSRVPRSGAAAPRAMRQRQAMRTLQETTSDEDETPYRGESPTNEAAQMPSYQEMLKSQVYGPPKP